MVAVFPKADIVRRTAIDRVWDPAAVRQCELKGRGFWIKLPLALHSRASQERAGVGRKVKQATVDCTLMIAASATQGAITRTGPSGSSSVFSGYNGSDWGYEMDMPDETVPHSFHDIPPELQHFLIRTRKGVGDCLSTTSGFAGRIFRFQAGTATETCVKVPLATPATVGEAATRFLRELRLQRAMYYHQFVHWPFDFDLIDDAPIAWFRFWDSDLAALIEDDRFTFEGRLGMLAYLAAALDHCHMKGLVAHQDLKPENVFVQDLRRVASGLPDASIWRIPKLADFGSVNLASECGVFDGTKAYMAPEQWRRMPLGRHTSVWSLGLIAYELLTFGQHPVGEPTRPWRNRASGVFNRWQKKRMWLRWLDGGCRPTGTVGDADLDELIRRCLDPDPAGRPAIAGFSAAILSALRQRSSADYEQANFRIVHAQDVSSSNHDWPYLDKRFNSVVAAVAERFSDPSVLDRYLISEEEAAALA
ncbi:hypothetical protein CFR75_15595 [Komagataeibacter xylinus]|uniref:non-specific serine/threonine protein kinase n=2 Tax=Komagataeibacter xylinus TaxID=28448 RepID=A0A318PF30_KOMXY|nr:hypothetical protein CFR75_15595 [Komagataeibacter xylinus]